MPTMVVHNAPEYYDRNSADSHIKTQEVEFVTLYELASQHACPRVLKRRLSTFTHAH